MTGDRAPDFSQHPSFGGIFKALTPGGTDTDRLLDSLKAAQQAGLIYCQDCKRTHPDNITCPERADREALADGDRDRSVPGLASPFPADPFTPGKLAAAATKDWYDDLLEAGIPLSSVEKVLGAMLACAAAFAADDEAGGG